MTEAQARSKSSRRFAEGKSDARVGVRIVSNRSGRHLPLNLAIGVLRRVDRLGKPATPANRAVVRDVVGPLVQYVDDRRVVYPPTPEDTHDQILGGGRSGLTRQRATGSPMSARRGGECQDFGLGLQRGAVKFGFSVR